MNRMKAKSVYSCPHNHHKGHKFVIRMKEAVVKIEDTAPDAHVIHVDPLQNASMLHTVVIGSGPVGIRFAKELLQRRPFAKITVFGNEPYQPYNRVQLSSLLAGDIDFDDIITDLPDKNRYPNFSHEICAIRGIDTERRTITGLTGDEVQYDRLIIATGSRPHVPNIPGVDQTGVYTFRNLKDAEFLYSRVSSARHIVVVGGGLLGLEAAKALSRFNTKVTLVQQGPRLMNRQLDENAAHKLQDIVESLGIRVITNTGVRKIVGEGRVEEVVTRDKERIMCDTVLLCAGIKPNIEIARTAKIKVGRGILVNDELRTSVKNVFAIGECCEHRGATYGLVNPGYEQASILADLLCGGSARYIGSLQISRLKVVGAQICSMGQVSDLQDRPFQNTFIFQDTHKNVYRKLITFKGKLIGAVGFGEWDESRRVQEAYQNSRRIWPWQILWFWITGNIFTKGTNDDIRTWPKNSVICQCNNITQGELADAILQGRNTLEKLQHSTGAGTVCGSCKPLLAHLLGNDSPPEKEKTTAIVLPISLLAIAIAILFMTVPGAQVSDSVQNVSLFEKIWNDKFWKQVTGFTLLGLSALGLLISLRKRIRVKFINRLGDYVYWRLLHICLGLACASTLILHTGLHLGENFNRILAIDFIGILIFGSLAGTAYSISHRLKISSGKKFKSFWTWGHILVTWPLPILLAIHILSVYYF